MVNLGAEIIFSINQSYFYYNKNNIRHNMYSELTNQLNVPFIFLNSIGIGDISKNILIYDGSSMHFNKNGIIVNKLKSFEEDVQIIEENFTSYIDTEKQIKINSELVYNKFKEITNALIFTLKEFYEINNIQKCEILLSGGIDSEIVIALANLVFKKENIVVITSPSSCNTKKIYNNVEHIINKLNLKLYINPIQEIYEKILEVDKKAFGKKLNHELCDDAKAHIQAIIRSCIGLYNTHRFSSILISTTNHSENSLGFSSYGDITYFGIAIIADIAKSECYQLAEYLNNEVYGDEIIPKNLYNGECKASAELPGNTGPDPIDYFIESGICCEIIRKNKSKKQLIDDFKNKSLTEDYFPILEIYNNKSIYEYTTLENFIDKINKDFIALKNSVFKTVQIGPVPLISPYNRGFSRRETLFNKYNY